MPASLPSTVTSAPEAVLSALRYTETRSVPAEPACGTPVTRTERVGGSDVGDAVGMVVGVAVGIGVDGGSGVAVPVGITEGLGLAGGVAVELGVVVALGGARRTFR